MATPMVGIRVPPGRPVPELARFAALCEEAGLGGVGVPDHHHVGRDAYVTLAAMAQATKRVTLFPATSNVVTRHPLVIASLVNSLYEVAPGRVMLTVAPGFLSVEKAGEPKARRDRLREAVLALRGLLGDGHATLDGHDLELVNHPAGVRVMMFASGPKMLELAGEVADGVFMLVGLDERSVSAARRHIARGAERTGRDPGEIEEVFIVPIVVDDGDGARAWAKAWFRSGHQWLKYPSASNLHWLRYAGVDLPDDYDPDSISDRLADRICDAFGLFGPPGHCADRLLLARERIGLRHAFLFPAHTWASHYELPRAAVEAYGEYIGPALRRAAAS